MTGQDNFYIRASGLSVHLPIFNINSLNLKKVLLRLGSNGKMHAEAKTLVVEALRNLSFAINEGDRVGLIGLNGAGKTTLLRVLAGVFHVTSGRLDIKGRVVPMLVTDIGMQDDASGYDNIRNCALQMGMSFSEIDAKIDEIAEFTELESYLSLPLYTYSSGMRTRLSFAIATAMDADILLLDEVIGAGDAGFKKKASDRFNDFLNRTKILIVATHDDNWIRQFCNKAMLLSEGRLVDFGPVEDVLNTYHQRL